MLSYLEYQVNSIQSLVEARVCIDIADFDRTLFHVDPHARLQIEIEDQDERAKREIEAEAVT